MNSENEDKRIHQFGQLLFEVRTLSVFQDSIRYQVQVISKKAAPITGTFTVPIGTPTESVARGLLADLTLAIEKPGAILDRILKEIGTEDRMDLRDRVRAGINLIETWASKHKSEIKEASHI